MRCTSKPFARTGSSRRSRSRSGCVARESKRLRPDSGGWRSPTGRSPRGARIWRAHLCLVLDLAVSPRIAGMGSEGSPALGVQVRSWQRGTHESAWRSTRRTRPGTRLYDGRGWPSPVGTRRTRSGSEDLGALIAAQRAQEEVGESREEPTACSKAMVIPAICGSVIAESPQSSARPRTIGRAAPE